MASRDIIVIGGSAGCFPALQTLVRSFPKNFPASVFVVVHTHSRAPSMLTEIIGRASALPACNPLEGQKLECGHIYIAPTDHHLIVAKEHIHVSHGPKEGLHRPSINATFRSAADSYRERVIGVLLSGMLDDGAAGLWEIARQGGVTVVQDPKEAQFDSMPVSALADAPVAFKLPAKEIASLLPNLVAGCEVPKVMINASGNGNRLGNQAGDQPDHEADGKFSGFTCPECRGPLYEYRDGPVEFRCRVGHSFPVKTLLDEATSTQERKLYEAIVALEEGADMAEYAASRNGDGDDLLAESVQLRKHADSIRKIIESRAAAKLD